MAEQSVLDPTLRVLGRSARYHTLQLMIVNLGCFAGMFHLLSNVFTGRPLPGQKCSPPTNDSPVPMALVNVDWTNSSLVAYHRCHMTVVTDPLANHSQDYDCVFGYFYDLPKTFSFRTEMNLVCDRSMLAKLTQTLVISGQGAGGLVGAILCDRLGRKPMVVTCHFMTLVVGMAACIPAPYALFGLAKFLSGFFQQGMVTSMASLLIELYPQEKRAIALLATTVCWGLSSCCLALLAYLWRDHSWRYLQYTLSAFSLLVFLQMRFMDESPRWLIANGRKSRVVAILKRAAIINRADPALVLQTLALSTAEHNETESGNTATATGEEAERLSSVDAEHLEREVLTVLKRKETRKLNIMDIFTHKQFLLVSLLVWTAWFTTGISYIHLYLQSTSLHGNPYLNFFLTALMELPPGLLTFFLMDRTGRKTPTRILYLCCGLGLTGKVICTAFAGNSLAGTLSVVSNMMAMFGAAGSFVAVFLITPELFPTNIRTQSVGVASLLSRVGGMLAPFIQSIAKLMDWGPSAVLAVLCFFVVVTFGFIPETCDHEIPHNMNDFNSRVKYRRQHQEHATPAQTEDTPK